MASELKMLENIKNNQCLENQKFYSKEILFDRFSLAPALQLQYPYTAQPLVARGSALLPPTERVCGP